MRVRVRVRVMVRVRVRLCVAPKSDDSPLRQRGRAWV